MTVYSSAEQIWKQKNALALTQFARLRAPLITYTNTVGQFSHVASKMSTQLSCEKIIIHLLHKPHGSKNLSLSEERDYSHHQCINGWDDTNTKIDQSDLRWTTLTATCPTTLEYARGLTWFKYKCSLHDSKGVVYGGGAPILLRCILFLFPPTYSISTIECYFSFKSRRPFT